MDDFFNALPRLIWHEDEPITWPSSVSLYFVSKLAPKQVKVVLTGEGSDELFAGYGRYRFYLLNRQMDGPLPHGSWPCPRLDTINRSKRPVCCLPPLRRKLPPHVSRARRKYRVAVYLDNFYSALRRRSSNRMIAET